jgi:uncharacterized protein YbdZ (MbtH family)
MPAGWTAVPLDGADAGPGAGTDTRERCLEHIEHVWQDMRPRSLRSGVEATEAAEGPR